MEESKERLTPEKVINILDKHGTKVTLDEAKIMLEFITKIAEIAVNQYLRE